MRRTARRIQLYTPGARQKSWASSQLRSHRCAGARSSIAAAIRPSRSTWCWLTAHWAGRPSPRGPAPAFTRRSSFATATTTRYLGKGVTKAVANVNGVLAKVAIGRDPGDQVGLDRALIAADGTPNKGKLGANAILGVSLAAAKAAAAAHGLPLYRYVGGANARVLPVPMANIINGGKHADNKIDFQEFMVMPVGAKSFREAIRTVSEVFHHLKSVLKKAGHNTNVGDEGGFAPNLDNEEAIKFILDAVDKAGYQAGRDKDIAIALDTACSELFDEGQRKGYKFWKSAPEKIYSSEQMVELFASWVEKYPMIVSIEDPLDQDDWTGYAALTKSLGTKIQIVGDDFYVTNTERLAKGISAAVHEQHPDQGQPDRHPHRDARSRRDGTPRRLDERDVSPLGRDRGHDHRRYRRRNQLRPDQDRQPEPLGPYRQVQSAPPNRGTTGIDRRVRSEPAAKS